MIEAISIKNMPLEAKEALLRELDYGSDSTFVLNKDGALLPDRYTGQPVRISNMIIFPGSAIILDDNPLSIIAYKEEFSNIF